MNDLELTHDEVNSAIEVKRETSDKKIVNPNFLAARASFTASIEHQQQQGNNHSIPLPTKHRGSYASATSSAATSRGSITSNTTSQSSTATPARSSLIASSIIPSSSSTPRADDGTFTSSSSTSTNNNKNWEQEILAQRRGSVKDISSRFQGSSKIETMADYEQRLRAYSKMKTMSYFQGQNTDLKSLSMKNKLKIMSEWKALFTKEKMGDLTTEAAKEFLSQYGLTIDHLTKEQWNEWLEVIETTLQNKNNAFNSRSDSNPSMTPITTTEISSREEQERQQQLVGDDSLHRLDVKSVDYAASYDSVEDGYHSPMNHKVQYLQPLRSVSKAQSISVDNLAENSQGNEERIASYWSNSFLSPSKQTTFSPEQDLPPQTLHTKLTAETVDAVTTADDSRIEEEKVTSQNAPSNGESISDLWRNAESEVHNPLSKNPSNQQPISPTTSNHSPSVPNSQFEIASETDVGSSRTNTKSTGNAFTIPKPSQTSSKDSSVAKSLPRESASYPTPPQKKQGFFACCSCLFRR